MSLLYQTTGIVLGWKNYAEADRWYSILTEEFGKIEFRARGAHKTLAKLAPHLEMVAEVDLLLVNGRLYETVAGVERKRAFPKIYNDYSRLLLAKNSLYLTDFSTRPGQEDDGLYGFICEWLEFIEFLPELSGERSAYLLSVFALRMLAVVGYQPELKQCLFCKRAILSQADKVAWFPLKGGVACKICTEKPALGQGVPRKINYETVQMLRYAFYAPLPDQVRLVLPGVLLDEFHEAVEALITCHFPIVPPNALRGSCVF